MIRAACDAVVRSLDGQRPAGRCGADAVVSLDEFFYCPTHAPAVLKEEVEVARITALKLELADAVLVASEFVRGGNFRPSDMDLEVHRAINRYRKATTP